MRNDDIHRKLCISSERIKEYQIKKIKIDWSLFQLKAIKNFSHRNFTVKALYNLRGNGGLKRNSLRKIISTDFRLFSDFFPVILVNPVACSSIIPLKPHLFDFVVFDEASQLRIEDTFVSLIRGKYKIISGDLHQMPPSNYFSSSIVVEDTSETEDEDDDISFSESNNITNLADSGSLLGFGEDSGYKRTYLDYHYRSRHPHLINFSNSAFYGTRLIPMPPKSFIKPIRFLQVDGIYEDKKVVNPEEAKAVVEIIKSLLP